jgi:hypothetical protein
MGVGAAPRNPGSPPFSTGDLSTDRSEADLDDDDETINDPLDARPRGGTSHSAQRRHRTEE